MNFDFLSPFLGNLSQVHIWFVTWLRGKAVGEDDFGNQYFESNKSGVRRWVLYHTRNDASEVPPEWHGWLHHQTDALPERINPLRRPWQRKYVSNMSGTDAAYLPPGHPLAAGVRAVSSSDYQAWKPN